MEVGKYCVNIGRKSLKINSGKDYLVRQQVPYTENVKLEILASIKNKVFALSRKLDWMTSNNSLSF